MSVSYTEFLTSNTSPALPALPVSIKHSCVQCDSFDNPLVCCVPRSPHSSESSPASTYLCRMSFHCRCTRVRTDRGLQVRKWLRTPRLMLSQTLFMLLSYALCPPLATPSPWQIGPGRVHLEDESRGEHNPEHCVILAKEGTKRWQGVSRHSRPCDGSRLACRWVELGRPGPTPVS